MGRDADGNWTPGWTPPDFRVDENGKIVGYRNDRTPNNWGRWGELDEVGTLNFITPERIAAAAGLVRRGRVVSCAIPLDNTGPIHPTRAGIVHMYAYTGTDFVASLAALRQRLADLPEWLPAKKRPCSAAALLSSFVTTPVSATATMFARSISKILFIFSTDSTIPP